MATIGQSYIEKAGFAAKEKGIDVSALIKIAGASSVKSSQSQPSMIEQRISDNAMTLFLNLLADATKDAFLGFATPPIPVDFFNVLLQNLYFCDNLEQAIRSITTTLSLAHCHLKKEVSKQHVTLSLQHDHNDPHHFILEYLFVLIHRLLSWLTGKQVKAIHGSVRYTPTGYQQEFSLLYRCPMTFNNAINSLSFSANILNFAVVRQRDEFSTLIKQFPLIVMRYPGEEQLIDRQIHQHLLEYFNLHTRFLTANEVAQAFDMSSATLRRKLARHLTSFAQIKEELRKSLSTKLLAQTSASIEHIAFQLNYSEARSFSRAFKQWTGLTPSQYRAHLLDHSESRPKQGHRQD